MKRQDFLAPLTNDEAKGLDSEESPPFFCVSSPARRLHAEPFNVAWTICLRAILQDFCIKKHMPCDFEVSNVTDDVTQNAAIWEDPL